MRNCLDNEQGLTPSRRSSSASVRADDIAPTHESSNEESTRLRPGATGRTQTSSSGQLASAIEPWAPRWAITAWVTRASRSHEPEGSTIGNLGSNRCYHERTCARERATASSARHGRNSDRGAAGAERRSLSRRRHGTVTRTHHLLSTLRLERARNLVETYRTRSDTL